MGSLRMLALVLGLAVGPALAAPGSGPTAQADATVLCDPAGDRMAVQRISADGRVAFGHIWSASGQDRPFRWTADGGVSTPPIPGAKAVNLIGLSEDGSALLGDFTDAGGDKHVFRWTSRGVDDLGSLGRDDQLVAASADGSVLFGAHGSHYGPVFRWTARTGGRDLGFDQMLILNASSNGATIMGTKMIGVPAEVLRWTARTGPEIVMGDANTFAGPNAMSADGSAFVVAMGSSDFRRGVTIPRTQTRYYWTRKGGLRRLDDGFLKAQDYEFSLSADGSKVVETVLDAANQWHAIVWTPTRGARALPGDNAAAWGISADGSKIVGFAHFGGPRRRAAVWEGASAPRPIGDPAWSLSAARGVSKDGSTVFGTVALSGDTETCSFISRLN